MKWAIAIESADASWHECNLGASKLAVAFVQMAGRLDNWFCAGSKTAGHFRYEGWPGGAIGCSLFEPS